jgi:hypothetical protein
MSSTPPGQLILTPEDSSIYRPPACQRCFREIDSPLEYTVAPFEPIDAPVWCSGELD